MCHASGELPQGGQLFGLQQVFLGDTELFIERVQLGIALEQLTLGEFAALHIAGQAFVEVGQFGGALRHHLLHLELCRHERGFRDFPAGDVLQCFNGADQFAARIVQRGGGKKQPSSVLAEVRKKAFGFIRVGNHR